MKSVLTTFIYVILFIIALSLWGFYSAIRPFRITSAMTPADFHVPFEKVSFETSDHVLIKGWFIPSVKPHAKTILLLHGYPADKGNILPSRLFLHRDYNLLMIDFRYFGESGGLYSTAGKDEVFDVLAAIQYLKSRGINEVGVWGFSMGGSVGLMAAEKAPEIKAIISESAYSDLDTMSYDYYKIPILRYPLTWLTKGWAWLFLGHDLEAVSPANKVKGLNIPILIMHSERDDVIPFLHAETLKKSLQQNKHAEFLFDKKARHGYPIEDYEKKVKTFFDKNLT